MWLVSAFCAMLMNARETVGCILTFCLLRQAHAERAVSVIPIARGLPHLLKRAILTQLITFFK